MDLSFRQLSLGAIFSFCLSMDDVNLKKGVSITSFSPMSVLVKVYLTNIVGVTSSRFLLAKSVGFFFPLFSFWIEKVCSLALSSIPSRHLID